MILKRDFYNQNAIIVARQLLGAVVVHVLDGQRVSGTIVETEAYTGLDDEASHAFRGRTPRTRPMWETTGHSYLYLNYGIHWLLNVTCEPDGQPAAVLIRAIEPLEGLDIMANHRQGCPSRQWTNGPGKLTKALGLDGRLNSVDMTTQSSNLWIERGKYILDDDVSSGPRVGLGKRIHTKWLEAPRRSWITSNQFVSRS
jgi:DNA-3-methyladenine glycosylase